VLNERLETSGVVTIDDAAVLRRAKELCEEAGIAWDRLSAFIPGTRILNERDRRECLMRAREQLIREVGDSRETQRNKRLDDVADVPMEATQIATGAETEDQEAVRAKRAAAELERWLEKVQALRKAS
jgi:hypothetical protein